MSTDFLPYRERTGPQHRFYVIKVERLDEAITWDYYVGYTNLYLQERWQRYEQLTDKVSRYFRRGQVRAIGYEYDHMKGWGPYDTKEEGLQAEGDLARALRDAGYAVYSDRLDKEPDEVPRRARCHTRPLRSAKEHKGGRR